MILAKHFELPLPRRATILVVDDDESYRELISGILSDVNCHVIETGNPDEVSGILKNERVSLVLLDIRMPGTDGFELLKRIRRKYTQIELPVILVSGKAGQDEIIHGLNMGANDYVAKSSEAALIIARINTQLRRLELEDTKDRVIGVVSHELKNPLANVMGAMEGLLSVVEGRSSAKPEKFFDIGFRNVARMKRLINDILDWDSVRSGYLKLRPAPLRLHEIAEECASDLMPYMREYGVSIRTEIPDVVVFADKFAVHRVLTNLISNAIKFTKRGGEVICACALANRGLDREEQEKVVREFIDKGGANLRASDDSEAIVAVVDQGVGIPFEIQETIFDYYKQVDPSDKVNGRGSGLGLSISRHLINQHGGDIWFASDNTKGTTFFFPLQLAQNAAAYVRIRERRFSKENEADTGAIPEERGQYEAAQPLIM